MAKRFALISAPIVFFMALASVAPAQTAATSPAPPPAAKHVWTNDDLQSDSPSPSTASPSTSPAASQEAASDALQKFRSLGKEDLGVAVLKVGSAPDVNFPGRGEWEQSLFDAKETWMQQVDRIQGNKNPNKAAMDEQIRAEQSAQKDFEHISALGIQQARALKDPVLKAHLEYDRRMEVCKQYSGDEGHSCLDNASQFKAQMQRAGTW